MELPQGAVSSTAHDETSISEVAEDVRRWSVLAFVGGASAFVAAAVVPADPLSTPLLVAGATLLGRASVGVHGARTHRAETESRGWAAVAAEIDRSRRTGHSFVLARLAPGGQPDRRSADVWASAVASAAVGLTRRVDTVWSEGGAAYVLLPESEAAAVQPLVARMSGERPALVAGMEVAAVTFPADGLTREALISALRSVPTAAVTAAREGQ